MFEKFGIWLMRVGMKIAGIQFVNARLKQDSALKYQTDWFGISQINAVVSANSPMD